MKVILKGTVIVKFSMHLDIRLHALTIQNPSLLQKFW